MPAIFATPASDLPSFPPRRQTAGQEKATGGQKESGGGSSSGSSARDRSIYTKPPLAAATPMAASDRFFFTAEEPGSHNMTIGGCWVFEDALTEEIVMRLFVDWTRAYPLFTQRPAGAYWQAVEDFDVRSHVQYARLPAPYGRVELEGAIATALQESLPYNRPLWKALVVTNYNETSWVIALLVHHAYGDGMGTMRSLLTQVLDSSRELRDLTKPAVRRMEREEEEEMAYKYAKLQSKSDYMYDLVQTVWLWVLDLMRLVWKWAVMLMQPRGALMRRGGYAKEVALSDPINLSDLKNMSKLYHASVNDIMVAAITRTLHAYFRQTGELDKIGNLYCLIPISLRETDDFMPGNKITGVIASLPIHQQDSLTVLQMVQDQMDDLKHSWESYLYYYFLSLSGWLPQPLLRLALSYLKRKIHITLTNVAGPRHLSSLENYKIAMCYGLPPQPCPGGLGICILSYHYKITISVVADHSHITPSAQSFIKLFHREFEALRSAARTTTTCPSARGRVCITCAQKRQSLNLGHDATGEAMHDTAQAD